MSGLDDLSSADAEIVETVISAHGYDSLKEIQELAFEDGILDRGNHLLVAETGNGKTLCAEAVAKKRLDRDAQVAYLVSSRSRTRRPSRGPYRPRVATSDTARAGGGRRRAGAR